MSNVGQRVPHHQNPFFLCNLVDVDLCAYITNTTAPPSSLLFFYCQLHSLLFSFILSPIYILFGNSAHRCCYLFHFAESKKVCGEEIKMSESDKEKGLDGAQCLVEAAINSIGLGFDICCDLSLEYCKARLMKIDNEDQVRNVKLPGGIFIPNVPISIKCHDFRGSRNKLFSDALFFDQMSELFNQELSLSGKTPTGHFNAAFGLSGVWHRDAADTKTLAFAGYSITLCKIACEKSKLVLCDHVKHDVPPSWDPAALARFIEKYGTHVLVGLKVGGTDIIYAKQPNHSPLQPADVQKQWREITDKFFIFMAERYDTNDESFNWKKKVQGVEFICKRKGGNKPPLDNLHQFLEFQLRRRWAPVIRELAFGPGRRPKKTASSNFGFRGPNLYVNTTPVDVGKKLVTGLRLSLEGKKSNHLAIHLQHLPSLPKAFHFEDVPDAYEPAYVDRMYYEGFRFKSFSHCCTAPICSENENSVVTGAHFEIRDDDHKKVLFLILHFSDVAGATRMRTEWDHSPSLITKFPTFSSFDLPSISYLPNPQPDTPKLSRFVDTTEITRGPQDLPGYWVVSGAKLSVAGGKITLVVKYSLLKIENTK
ncbi:hypothetical protein RIF29_06667 [Crotalaria pallida]|uniref:MACPF domain-containing protein n=1 Tax=Crotalaria pallida TaxID=3830 RepID=A0AAN9J3R1_CROPI